MNFLYYISKIIKKMHIPSIKNSKVDSTSKVCSGSHLVRVTLGRYSYIGNYCCVINTDIGNFCSIADNCIIGGPTHPITWVSTSPVFHEGKNVLKKNFSNHKFDPFSQTVIGNDVWIGSNSLIKGGITIGDGSIIGMGSVVTKNIGNYEIWAGNPAKLIRNRFNDETVENLLLRKWWQLNDASLEQLSINFDNVEKFTEQI